MLCSCLFLIFLVLLFNLSSQIVLIVLKGRLVRIVGVVFLWICLSCSLVYGYFATGFVLALFGVLFVVSDWGVVEDISVSVISIRFDRHIFLWYRRLLGLGVGGW